MMMRDVENGMDNKENYLFSNFQRLQENVTQIPKKVCRRTDFLGMP